MKCPEADLIKIANIIKRSVHFFDYDYLYKTKIVQARNYK